MKVRTKMAGMRKRRRRHTGSASRSRGMITYLGHKEGARNQKQPALSGTHSTWFGNKAIGLPTGATQNRGSLFHDWLNRLHAKWLERKPNLFQRCRPQRSRDWDLTIASLAYLPAVLWHFRKHFLDQESRQISVRCIELDVAIESGTAALNEGQCESNPAGRLVGDPHFTVCYCEPDQR
jgi:hypothetical protein